MSKYDGSKREWPNNTPTLQRQPAGWCGHECSAKQVKRPRHGVCAKEVLTPRITHHSPCTTQYAACSMRHSLHAFLFLSGTCAAVPHVASPLHKPRLLLPTLKSLPGSVHKSMFLFKPHDFLGLPIGRIVFKV